MSLRGHILFSGNGFVNIIKYIRFFRRTTYISTTLLSLLVLAILCPIYLIPDTSEAATHDATPATLNYTSIRSTASVSLDVSSVSGSFATSGSNETASFSLSTNNATGYTLNLKTSGDDTSLTDSTNSNASTNHLDIINATKTAESFSNNTWGLLPSKYNGIANTTNYYPASNAGFTMDETNAANSTDNTYTIGLGVKADFTMPTGTYTNSTIIAEYVAKPITYAIYYYSNTEDTVTNMPATNPQTGTVSQGTISTSVNLAAAPSRTGYLFLGWCQGSSSAISNITTTDGVDTCSTTAYTANQSFGINATNNPDNYYLYAMWQINTFTITLQYNNAAGITVDGDTITSSSVSLEGGTHSISGIYNTGQTFDSWSTSGSISVTSTSSASTTLTVSGTGTLTLNGKLVPVDYCTENNIGDGDCMQKMVESDCTTTPKSVMDSRDGNTYVVQRLEDNNCWLLNNLSLDLADEQVQLNLSNSTTNATEIALNYLKNGGGTGNYAPTPVVDAQTDFNKYSQPMINSALKNNEVTAYGPGATNEHKAKTGIYYNYCAASAGSFCYGENLGSGNTVHDICPKGWRMPTGGFNNGEIYDLCKAVSSDNPCTTSSSMSMSNSNDLLYKTSVTISGSYYIDNVSLSGMGFIWTSSSSSRNYIYLYHYSSNYICLSCSVSTPTGASARCILKKQPRSLTVDFAGSGVTSVQVRSAPDGGGILLGTVTTSGDYIANLDSGLTYYLYPTFADGYAFDNWTGTDSDMLKSTSDPNTSFVMKASDSTVTITGRAIYNITYKPNGGQGNDYTQLITRGSSDYLLSNNFTRSNYYFKGWGVAQNTVTYRAGQLITPSADMILYAIWAPSTNTLLYDAVVSLSKGIFSNDHLNDALTTDNSGVFKYDGSHSDGNNIKDIYFYRGILDGEIKQYYGATGDGKNYPNFVTLHTGDNITCWRIMRTTGSGGIKMLYNGMWTDNSCANVRDAAVTDVYFNRPADFVDASSCTTSNSYCGIDGFITYVGYNYNNSYAYNNTGYTTAISNAALFNNGTSSNARSMLEEWYANTIGSANNNLFETNAGYCNDRTTFVNTNGEYIEQNTTAPYTESSNYIVFGSTIRLNKKSPSLKCPNTSGNDLLNGTNGKAYPIALATTDELALGGYSVANPAKCYLAGHYSSWTLSPYKVNYKTPAVYTFRDSLSYTTFGAAYKGNIRPVVSLAPGTTITGGSGTATDPWTVQ